MADFLWFIFVVPSNVVNAIVVPIIYRFAHRLGINLNLLIFLKFAARSTAYFALWCRSSERINWRELVCWSTLACVVIAGPLGGTFPEVTYVLSMNFIPLWLAGIVSVLTPLFTIIPDVIRRKEKFLSWKVVGILVSSVGSAMFLGMMNEGNPFIDLNQSAHDLAPSPMPSTSTTGPRVLVDSIVCIASSTAITLYFSDFHQEKLCPDLAYTFAMGGLMDFFGALIAGIFFRFQFKDLQLNTTIGGLTFCCVFTSVIASVGLKWCEQQKGKSYVAAFSSLPLIIDTIAAPLALTGELHWGSVASCILMIIAICPSIWAKAKEAEDAHAAASTTVTEDVHADASNDYTRIPCCQDDSNLNLLGQEKDSSKRLGSTEQLQGDSLPITTEKASLNDKGAEIVETVIDVAPVHNDDNGAVRSEQLQGDSLAITTEKASSALSNDKGAEMSGIVQTIIDVAPVHNDDNGAVRSEQLQGDSFPITMEEASSITSNDQGIETMRLVLTVINVNEEGPAHSDDLNGEMIEADDDHHIMENDDQEIEIDDDPLGNKALDL